MNKSGRIGSTQEVKPGYQKTKLGWIPEEWELEKLGKIAQVDPESLGSKTDEDYTFRYVSLSDIENGVISENLETYTFKHSPSRAKRLVQKGDVLLATVRPNLKAFAKVKNANNLVVSTGFAVLRAKLERLDSNYLLHSIYGTNTEKQIYGLVVGSNYPAINSKDVKNLRIPLPPLPEQRQIARILSTWDKAIDTLQKLIAKKQERKKGLMQQLLTGKKRFAGFEGEWKEVRLKEHLKINKGKAISKSEIIPGSYAVIAGGKSSPYRHNTFTHQNVITISASGAYAGYVAMYKEKIWASDCSVITSSDYYDLDFIFYLLSLNQRKLYSMQSGGAQPHVYPKDIESLKFFLPKLREQQKIASVLSTADLEIEKLQGQLEKLQEQKKGLMQKLLTGEVRVKSVVNNE